jgi:uncharacterized cofD-like protein
MHPNLVVIGGGSGSFTLLQELKHWTPNISAIVNMSDNGGSSGELRDELGVLPPGDIRQCLVALSNYKETRNLFSYRFGEGKLEGHPVGNIILSALELQYGSFTQAVKIVSELLQITGKVIPVSTTKHHLCMIDGKQIIKGEFRVAAHQLEHKNAKIYLEPKAIINPEANQAIKSADLVIIAPGNLYGSLLPALAVDGMKQALKQTKAKVVMVANLINKPKQTMDWHVANYFEQMEKYIDKDTIDIILYNNKPPNKELLKKYAQDNEYPPKTDQLGFSKIKAQMIGTNLVASQRYRQDPNDKAIKRSLIRHNANEVQRQLQAILEANYTT